MNYYTLTNYRALNGFLRFFQVTTIITIVFGGITFLSQLGSLEYGFSALLLLQFFTVALYLLARIFYLVFLSKRNKSLPLFYLLTHIGLSILSYIGAFFLLSSLNFYYGYSPVYSQITLTTVQLIITICVFVYFKKSERYKIYIMSEPEYAELYAYYSAQLSVNFPGMNMGQPSYPGQPIPQQPYYPAQGNPYSQPMQPYNTMQFQNPAMGGQAPSPSAQPYNTPQYPAPNMQGTQPSFAPQVPPAPASQAGGTSPQGTQPTYTGQPLPPITSPPPSQIVNPYHSHNNSMHTSQAQPGQPSPTYTGQPLPTYTGQPSLQHPAPPQTAPSSPAQPTVPAASAPIAPPASSVQPSASSNAEPSQSENPVQ